MNHAIKLVYAIVLICVCTSVVFAGYAWLHTKINASDGAAGDAFGGAVVVSGDWAVVGAYADDSLKGAAYVYKRISGAWIQQQKLTASDGVAGDCFGVSVAIYGNYIIVGANKANSNKGAAYIFKLTNSVWGQHKRITASDGYSGDLFGQAVAIYGNWAVVGAEGDNVKKGSIYTFVVSDTSTAEYSRLVSSTQASSSRFGCSISMYNTSMLVGAYTESGKGAAYFFWQSGGIWQSTSYRVVAYDAATGDNFGCSVAIYGDYAVIGASKGNVGATTAGVESGSAYIYRYSLAEWQCPAELTPSDGTAGDLFGQSVSMNGNSILIGAPGKDNGAAYMYSVGNWTSSHKITAAYSAADDFFGGSVCTNGTYMMCGDVNDDDFGINSGSAYIFEYTELGTLTLLTPNGGENLAGGSAYDITWSSTGPIETVMLDYSADNAATWTAIGTAPDTGSYEWTVADANSSQCRLRVRDAGASGAFDTSDNMFRIYRCTLDFDLNHDCIVDFLDFAELSSEWLKCGDPADTNCVQ